MELPEISDYTRLFLEDTPLLDVRAPVEFEAGAFPTAHNLPLLTDEERHLIGIRYKEAGQEAAVELGRELVNGLPRKERTERWAQFVEKHPQGVLYCFRGGMRSRITQEWIYAATGIAYPRIKGGYKALRNFLLEQIELSVSQLQPLVIGGRTGAGKTILIKRVFDLVKDFGTSKSPKSTRSSTTHWCPGRPGHPAFRHNIASSLRLHTGLPYDWTPRSDAPLGSPLAPSARRVSRVASRLPGTTRLRFALHGGQRKKVKSSIDLEGLAWHRGSAFGRHVTPQPTQIDFENRLSIAMLKHRVMKSSTVVLEDESKAIGSRHLPPALYERMSESPLAILEVSLEERIKNSIDEYVTAALEEYQAHYGEEQGMEEWESYARESLKRIARRLGGERYQRMEKSLDSAMREMHGSSGHQAHADWIAQLLVDYYDPMYDYQLKKKEERIVFSGDMNAVIQYIEEITGHE